ncbi:MAG: sulfatase-like hydrolase/transferase, partial [Anaerolineae bacterium]|nr:sulfatase-like hydrolase/transferase [Anaerolineae bacterium]
VAWLAGVFLAYIVGLAHLWAAAEPGWLMALVASAGLLAAVQIYSTLGRPAELVAAPLSRFLAASNRLLPVRRISVALLGCSLVLWVSGWTVALRARARANQVGLNLIIIAVDTLREDAVNWHGQHGHDTGLTPNLQRLLAARATVFSRAFSQAPWTLPAFASIFTGLYPEQHGAERSTSQLLPGQLTLAEILREAGYLTMSVVSGHFVSSEVGMTQGFILRHEPRVFSLQEVTSPNVTERALKLLADHRDGPFFLFVHYFDPHADYRNHSEFAFETGRAWQQANHPGFQPWARFWSGRRQPPIDAAGQAEIRALYDEEVAYTDLHIGRLLTFLDENGLWESTCVVLVADHGEEFLDHGSGGHGHTLFQELIHVPLLIADPSRDAPAVISDPVETRWIFATILEMLGISPPDQQVPWRTLFARHQDERH